MGVFEDKIQKGPNSTNVTRGRHLLHGHRILWRDRLPPPWSKNETPAIEENPALRPLLSPRAETGVVCACAVVCATRRGGIANASTMQGLCSGVYWPIYDRLRVHLVETHPSNINIHGSCLAGADDRVAGVVGEGKHCYSRRQQHHAGPLAVGHLLWVRAQLFLRF